MRKNLLFIILISSLLLFSGCGSDNNVKVYENTEDVGIEHIEQSMTAVIKDMDFENNIISFVSCIDDKEYQLIYHGGVTVANTYGTLISISDIFDGIVVDVVYYSDTNKLVSITLSDSVTTMTGVTKFSADTANGKATYKGTSVPLWKQAMAFDGNEQIGISEVSTEDQVTLNIYGGKLVSVVIEVGHGYVRLANHDTYVGGMVEIGYDVIVPVTQDMLVAVREGSYTLRINKNGYSDSKDVKVIKGTETVIDLADIAIPTGFVAFNITPADAVVYINGKKLSGHSYSNIYGTYGLKIEADGYKSFNGSIKIGKSVTNLTVDLIKLEEEDEDETTETTEDSSDTTTEEDASDTTEDNTQDGETTEDGSTEESDSTEGTTEDVTTDNVITVSTPIGVGVYLDGEYIGEAPISFPKTVGAHTITLYKAGFIIKSYTIYATNNGKDDEYKFNDLVSLPDIVE